MCVLSNLYIIITGTLLEHDLHLLHDHDGTLRHFISNKRHCSASFFVKEARNLSNRPTLQPVYYGHRNSIILFYSPPPTITAMSPVATSTGAQALENPKSQKDTVFNPFYSPSIGDDGNESYPHAEYKVWQAYNHLRRKLI
jgi:hypothetical protein